MIRFGCLVFISFFLPQLASAAVTISEVAWMGGVDSANHEWIELYNDGPTVNVDGWLLTDNENLTIDLTGSIPGNSFVVLERTSDESANGTAFLIYTGALKNTGTTLSLYRADGGLEDQVSGGENWQNIGGDNTTKETAQYTTSGWTTAVGTPGKANAQFEPLTTPTESVSNSSGSSARLAEPVNREPLQLIQNSNELALSVTAPEQVFIHQPVTFKIEVTGVGSTIENSLKYMWNFGDTNVSVKEEPTHSFMYPGTYVVHVSAEFGTQNAATSHIITVLPVAVSLTKNQTGDVQINNDSAYTIDLSGYRLRAHKEIELPANTQLLSQQTITVPLGKIQDNHLALVALYDNASNLVASVLPSRLSFTAPSVEPEPVVRAGGSFTPESSNPAFQFVSTVEASETEVTTNTTTTADTLVMSSDNGTGTPNNGNTNWPVYALIALLIVSCIVILMQPKRAKDSLDTHE